MMSQPTIINFSPTSGVAGNPVVILGSNFSQISRVEFGGTAAIFTIDSGTQITAIVPRWAISGSISVAAPGVVVVSGDRFLIAAENPALAAHEASTNHPLATGSAPGFLSAADKAKLNTVAPFATANSSDTALRDRATHTGTQAANTIAGLGDAAFRNVGSGAGTVAAGDDSRFNVFGGKKHSRGLGVPASPDIGDTRDELDSTGNLIQTWFWNGSLWLSTDLRFLNGLNGTGLSATSGSSNNLIVFTRSLFVERVIYAGRVNGTHDATNFWTFTWFARKKSDSVSATLFELDTRNYLSSFSLPINPVEIDYKQLVDKDIYYAITPRIAKVQSPANLETYSSTLYFRHVRA